MMIEIDYCHRQLIGALVMSHKPGRVIEFGVGTGLTTQVLRDALAYNGRGVLTCVENLRDWAGVTPSHIEKLIEQGVHIEFADEGEYLALCPSGSFDFVVSDADHSKADQYLADYLRVTADDGIMVFHDTLNEQFPNLRSIHSSVGHLPHVVFSKSSRSDEQCSRGLTLVFNDRRPN